MNPLIPNSFLSSWGALNNGNLGATASLSLERVLAETPVILPSGANVFRAFELLPPENVSVVIIGQDPYPNPDDAMGVAFSSPQTKLPSSLRNIYKEIASDLDTQPPFTGDLSAWVTQGVLLANTSLTLAANGKTHFKHWEAQIEASNLGHVIIESAHPSPLSAIRCGFFGSKPFSKTNAALESLGLRPINWA
jgi:uracil-DNA glycosylase